MVYSADLELILPDAKPDNKYLLEDINRRSGTEIRMQSTDAASLSFPMIPPNTTVSSFESGLGLIR